MEFGRKSDIERIRQQVEVRKLEEAEQLAGQKQESEPDPVVNSKFVKSCLDANEVGDGMLFAELNAGRCVFNASSGEWYIWRDHYWQRDTKSFVKIAVEETVVQAYLSEAGKIENKIRALIEKKQDVEGLEKLRKQFYKRIKKLRSDAGRKNCLSCACSASNSDIIESCDLDQDPWYLGCQNGVIDLRTGRLRDGRPNDLISKVCAVEYPGIDAPAPTFELYLREILKGRQPVIDFLARLLGYALTGLTTERVMPLLCGDGWNGKGTLLEIISQIMGDYAAPIPAEMLLDQGRFKTSSGPSPDIMALRGLRMAFASETDEGRRFSTSRVKWLTGGDTLVGRNPHDKYSTNFRPSHTLFLITNHEPSVSATDFAFWERIALIKFELSFVDRPPQAENERPRDKDLPEKLLKEGPAILAWLVRGCLEYQQKGLDPPDEVRQQTAKYRRSLDNLQDWIDECCIIDEHLKESAKDLYGSFEEWWESNISKKVPSQNKFGKWLGKRFPKERTGKSGTYEYFGIVLNNIE